MQAIRINYRRLSLSAIIILGLFIPASSFSQADYAYSSSDKNPGMRLLPVPQKASFTGRNFILSDEWLIDTGNILSTDEPIVKNLVSGLKEHGVEINFPSNNKKQKLIRLFLSKGSVPVPEKNTSQEIIDQAYRLKLDTSEISISANSQAGIFYGIQTLLQLLSDENGKLKLPEGEIIDWPDMNLRIIYWDCAHHLERMDAFKRIIRQAASYKINAIALKLEGHFQFASAEPIVEPYAFSPAEYQELTDYAKGNFVELIPYLDAPAHVSFILKHPEYDSLRAIPNSNYELSVTSPGTFKLITGMFDELMAANKGCRHVLLSTDEAYYVGKNEKEKEAAEKMGGNGKLLTDFITRISDYLHEKGRTVIFWGEYPLTKSDIHSLPGHLINGVYNESWAPEFMEKGIQQLIYTSAQGEEPLFPNYYPLKLKDTTSVKKQEIPMGRVDGLIKDIYPVVAKENSAFPGVIVAAWGDTGLNPETFWLGYTTGAAAAWNNSPKTAEELTERFFISFYGSESQNMTRIYQLTSSQAEVWNNSWDRRPSDLRTPIIGNSYGIYDKPKKATDHTLPLLPIPSSSDLSLDRDWSAENANRIKLVERYIRENDELLDLLKTNIKNADRQKYNLQVIQSIAMLCRQNLNMLLELQNINELLKQSSKTAPANPSAAISLIDQALDRVTVIRNERDETLRRLTTLWYKDWYPRVNEANGRRYLLIVDDVKDHLPVRTADMSYLIYRELNYPLGDWTEKVVQVRNQFAKEHQLSTRKDVPEWSKF